MCSHERERVGVAHEREGERELMREEELSYITTYHTDKIDKESEKRPWPAGQTIRDITTYQDSPS